MFIQAPTEVMFFMKLNHQSPEHVCLFHLKGGTGTKLNREV